MRGVPFRQTLPVSRTRPPDMHQITPKVSVLVPVYNSGDYLIVCIESLEKQTIGDNIEFICVNDGSTDESPARLDDWAARDPRVKVIHQKNGGYGKAMNAALDAASGSYIGIVEPDDWVEPDMFSNLLRLAEETGADIAKGIYVGETEKASHADTRFNSRLEGEVSKPEDFPEYLVGAPSIWAAIYRKEMIDAHKIHFSETPGASFQDFGFFIRTWAAAERIATTNTPVYHYREDNPDSSSRKLDSGAWAALYELESLTDIYHHLSTKSAVVRSSLVRRIFHTMQADYRLRISCRIDEFLSAYSTLLRRHFPFQSLLPEVFTRREWHDLRLIYKSPRLFPSRRKGNLSILQRIYSCRREAGHRVLRLCGFAIHLSH